jgi:basic membrane lipoprotein Med (substrate-binding protein (PBP1-ABC) superfamily)
MLTRFRRLSTAAFAAVAFTLGACSGGDAGKKSQSANAFKVALLTPGPISDKSWNAGAYAGLMAIRDSLDAEVSHIQTRTPAEFDENFRQYGAGNFNLVFGHGFEFQDAAIRVATAYPNTDYVIASGTSVADNVSGISFAFEEASYLAGMIAGRMTRSNFIGMIGGTELPPVKRSFAAFEQGAKSVNPRVRVVVSYIGNWDDVSAGKEQAIAQISRGADIIFQNADAAGLGVFQAVKDATLGSVVIDLPHAFLLVARTVQTQGFTGKVFTLGLHDKVVTYVPNPVLTPTVPQEIKTAVDSVERLMIDGAFGDKLLPDSMRITPVK